MGVEGMGEMVLLLLRAVENIYVNAEAPEHLPKRWTAFIREPVRRLEPNSVIGVEYYLNSLITVSQGLQDPQYPDKGSLIATGWLPRSGTHAKSENLSLLGPTSPPGSPRGPFPTAGAGPTSFRLKRGQIRHYFGFCSKNFV